MKPPSCMVMWGDLTTRVFRLVVPVLCGVGYVVRYSRLDPTEWKHDEFSLRVMPRK